MRMVIPSCHQSHCCIRRGKDELTDRSVSTRDRQKSPQRGFTHPAPGFHSRPMDVVPNPSSLGMRLSAHSLLPASL